MEITKIVSVIKNGNQDLVKQAWEIPPYANDKAPDQTAKEILSHIICADTQFDEQPYNTAAKIDHADIETHFNFSYNFYKINFTVNIKISIVKQYYKIEPEALGNEDYCEEPYCRFVRDALDDMGFETDMTGDAEAGDIPDPVFTRALYVGHIEYLKNLISISEGRDGSRHFNPAEALWKMETGPDTDHELVIEALQYANKLPDDLLFDEDWDRAYFDRSSFKNFDDFKQKSLQINSELLAKNIEILKQELLIEEEEFMEWEKEVII